MSETSICNFAISRTGSSQFIADMNEQSVPANVCKLWYPQCRDAVLRSFPWGFATKIVALAPVSGMDDLGYGYTYALPSDYLYAQAMTNATAYNSMQRGVGGLRWFWEDYGQTDWARQYSTGFDIIQHKNKDQAVIATGWSDAYLVYVARSESTNLYPSDFIDALAWKLASEIALPMTAKADVMMAARRAFEQSIREAWTNALNEKGQRPQPDSVSVSCR